MLKKQTTLTLLSLGALGVVFGDIGTSPLYALSILFGTHGRNLAVNSTNVIGIISLIIWAITIVVSVKYIGFVMRASNDGEGGIMALVSLIQKSRWKAKSKWLFVTLGIVGIALFYGDSTITPAISVLSAVGGLKTITASLAPYVVPITVAIIILLFGIQRYGTALIGWLFGPVMLLWFIVIGVAGAWQICHFPAVLKALSPWSAISFFGDHPATGFIVMTAVILAVTGAEALYADMGHFGRRPIATAWFIIVFPALALCYMGQGAVLLSNNVASSSPFFYLFSSQLFIPIIILATAATLIASQSVISGAFSLTRQAVHLGFLPNMLIRHTSDEETGQIYIPFINIALFIAVVGLVIGFGSSDNLAGAYGVAISGALLADTAFFIALAAKSRYFHHWSVWLAVFVFLPLDLLFVASNLTKVPTGGWFPLLIAGAIFIVINSWIRGQRIVAAERQRLEGPLDSLTTKIHQRRHSIVRLPGSAVYIAHHSGFAPLALHTSVDSLNELHTRVLIVHVHVINSPHVRPDQRIKFEPLPHDDHISYLEITYGYHDTPNVPRTLEAASDSDRRLHFDWQSTQYFVSLAKLEPAKDHRLVRWRQAIYLFLEHNARSASDHYHLPVSRTIDIESIIEL